MSTRDIVECSVSDVLKSSSNTGRRVVLHCRHVDDLRYLVRHNAGHVGAGFPFAEEIRIAINGRFIADTTTRECILNTDNSNLRRQ